MFLFGAATVAVVANYINAHPESVQQAESNRAQAVKDSLVYMQEKKEDEEGSIYVVGGDKTSSGDPYVGSTDDLERRAKEKSDGRDRTGADAVDTYPVGDRQQRRNKEQQKMNDLGGVEKLDNKRNKVAPRYWPARGIKPPR